MSTAKHVPAILCALAAFVVSACAPVAAQATPQVVTVYSTSAAQPWLTDLYDCAGRQSAVLSVVTRPEDAMLVLRVGEPDGLVTPAFEVGTDDVLVVVNHVHPFNSLDAGQVRNLFTGQAGDWSAIDPSKTGRVQVWVFAPDEDVQQVFADTLAGQPVVSNARLATSPDEMSQAIAGDENAIGLLSRHWKMGNVADVYVAATVPVLAITPSEPQGVLKDLLGCLQK